MSRGAFSPFRPAYQHGYSSNYIAMLTHSRLIDLDHLNEPHGDLATEWTVSDDATTYTFKLREDTTWHDSQPVTAKDVEAVADDYNITFTLEQPVVGWHKSAKTDLQILPAHIFKDVKPEDIVEHHAPAWYAPELNLGSGPFKFVKAERDQFVELVCNDVFFATSCPM